MSPTVMKCVPSCLILTNVKVGITLLWPGLSDSLFRTGDIDLRKLKGLQKCPHLTNIKQVINGLGLKMFACFVVKKLIWSFDTCRVLAFQRGI